MNIVDSNSFAPLKYTDPTYQVLLYVRANIYDLSGGSPVLEGFVNLILLNNGVYQGKYKFTAGKPYLIQKLVYDSGYTTVDQTFAQDNDDIQCVDLIAIAKAANASFIGIEGILDDELEIEGEVDCNNEIEGVLDEQ